MATGASAQIPAMAQAAVQVDQASQRLTNLRSGVATSVANTLAGYQSDAATLFGNVMDQWGAEFQKIINGLNEIHEALTATQRGYQASVDQDRASANSIMSALNNPSA
jgi:WXG100 family type VII secretion target